MDVLTGKILLATDGKSAGPCDDPITRITAQMLVMTHHGPDVSDDPPWTYQGEPWARSVSPNYQISKAGRGKTHSAGEPPSLPAILPSSQFIPIHVSSGGALLTSQQQALE